MRDNLFNTGIRPAIDDYLDKKRAEKRDYGDYWSASSAGYCMRKVIFERLGVPPIKVDGDERKQRVFEAGHIFHGWIQDITKNAGLSIAQELEVQDEELMIRGHIDDLVLIKGELPDELGQEHDEVHGLSATPADDHLILYDYKTVHSKSFHWAKKSGSKMSHYHRYQLGTYMYMLRSGAWPKTAITEAGAMIKDLAESRILKLSKDDLCMDEQQLMWSKELEKDIVDYWTRLNKYWKDKKLPPCTCDKHEGGFMAKPNYNPYYYAGEPCSIEYYKKWKKEKANAK